MLSGIGWWPTLHFEDAEVYRYRCVAIDNAARAQQEHVRIFKSVLYARKNSRNGQRTADAIGVRDDAALNLYRVEPPCATIHGTVRVPGETVLKIPKNDYSL